MKIPRLSSSLCSLSILLAAASCRSSSSRPPVEGKTTAEPQTIGTPAPSKDSAAAVRASRAQMTDAEITTAVLHEIAEDGAVDAAKIHVRTTNGIVELTGTVDNVLAKELATRHAEVVKGVRAVANRVVADVPRVPDRELAEKVGAALRADPVSQVIDLGVTAKDGVVKLTGKASSFQQRLFAERVVKRIRGVSDVDDRIDVLVDRERSDAEIARDVAARLRWDVLVDHGMIGIDVRDDQVRLHGVVGSAAEKSHAERDAWVSGVRAVDSSALRVDPWTHDDLRRDKYVIKSGAEVTQALRDALSYDPRVSTLLVRATASGGVATLSGSVPTLAARKAAEDIAMHTVGVHAVNNYLEVKPPKAIGDLALENKIAAALDAHPYTDEHEIRVVAKGGKVTLSGTVDSAFERAEAEEVVAGTEGVHAVDNWLIVGRQRTPYVYRPYAYPLYPHAPTTYHSAPPYPEKPDAEIAKDLRDQLHWSPFIRDDRVNVSVRNGKATLSGVVDSIHEKRVAADSALEAGAVTVDNQLDVR